MLAEIKHYLPIAQAIEMLLYPYAEIVLHDLATNTIAAIFNSFSHREPGDDSLLEEIEFDRERGSRLVLKDTPSDKSLSNHGVDESKDVIGPYEKLNWDGRKLKSISAVIRNSTGKAVGLMCINLDLSKFEEFRQIIDRFMCPDNLIPQPQELFKDDWQERINIFVHEHLRKQHKHFDNLTRTDKQELVKLLNREGAFKQKNAASYIGKVLGISRATVYKYLSEFKN